MPLKKLQFFKRLIECLYRAELTIAGGMEYGVCLISALMVLIAADLDQTPIRIGATAFPD